MSPRSIAAPSLATSAKAARRRMAVVGLVAIAIGSIMSLATLYGVRGDVTIFGAFGEDATATREYGEDRLGQVFLRPNQGHDGKFFFVQANDPWLLDPANNAQILDRPLYRSQRMLYPVLAGGAGLFGPETIIWAMLIINVMALGVGSWVAAALAVEIGGSPWWGLAFVLNIGFISEMNIGGSGIVAAVAAFGAVVMLLRGRPRWGIVLLLAAALSREAMLIVAAGSAWWLWTESRRRDAWMAAIVPALGVGLWALYVRARIGWDVGFSEVREIGLPVVGFVMAAKTWTDEPLNLVVGVFVLVLLVLFSLRVYRTRELVGWAFLGFALLGVMFTEQVWRSYFDITRAVAPAITAFVLLAFVGQHDIDDQLRTSVRP